jgi:hypothetical protein
MATAMRGFGAPLGSRLRRGPWTGRPGGRVRNLGLNPNYHGPGSPGFGALAAPAGVPPIPPDFYNPERQVALEQGQEQGRQTLEDIGTKRTRGESDYTLGVGETNREIGERDEGRQRALAQLQQSYARLGGQQEEQANSAGVLRGGALLQAAAARAANQGKANEGVNREADTAIAALRRHLGDLALTHQREGEDLTQGEGRTEQGLEQLGLRTGRLETSEAVANGYVAPSGPARSLYPLVNSRGEHYRQIVKGGQRIHLYHSGRKVIVGRA